MIKLDLGKFLNMWFWGLGINKNRMWFVGIIFIGKLVELEKLFLFIF